MKMAMIATRTGSHMLYFSVLEVFKKTVVLLQQQGHVRKDYSADACAQFLLSIELGGLIVQGHYSNTQVLKSGNTASTRTESGARSRAMRSVAIGERRGAVRATGSDTVCSRPRIPPDPQMPRPGLPLPYI